MRFFLRFLFYPLNILVYLVFGIFAAFLFLVSFKFREKSVFVLLFAPRGGSLCESPRGAVVTSYRGKGLFMLLLGALRFLNRLHCKDHIIEQFKLADHFLRGEGRVGKGVDIRLYSHIAGDAGAGCGDLQVGDTVA